MKKLILLHLFLISGIVGKAQFKFLANNCSAQYKAKIFVANSVDGRCDGKATIMIYNKITSAEIQTLHSENLDFVLNKNQDAKLGWIELGKYQTPLIFGDFNFDGLEDLAIRNGNKGAYASPSYDVYLSFSKGNRFVLNKELTKLASEHLGLFEIDKKSKQLTIAQKDGCCFQKTISYAFDKNSRLTEMSSIIEDSSIGDEVTVITQKKVNGKMAKTIQKFKTKAYYKE